MNFCPKFFKKSQKGFTLIELLVVIGILAVLLSIVLIAINPARQFGQANNTKRRSDVTAILNAIGAYGADNHGQLPAGIPVGADATAAVDIASGAGNADVCSAIMSNYISALPQDPDSNNGAPITDCTTYNSHYQVYQDANRRVTVIAPNAENSESISITR
jgi:prepilin-type N-terminal cleavage/methylation domain-containing protein